MKQWRVAKQGTKELGSYRKNSEISQTTSRTHVKKNPDQAISEFFLIKNPGICSGALRWRIRAISRQDPPAPCSKQQEAGGYTMGVLFLPKSTHHLKIPRSATWFHSRNHSNDACSCSARPEATRWGFQSSTMKCSGACRCGTHGIHRKEERRSSLIRIPPM